MEYQLRDRLSFMRFVGLGLGDAVPDAKTLWLYREALTQAGAVEGLFNQFDGYLKAKGYLAMGGQIIDATIVPTPRQRNSREDNAAVKAGKTRSEEHTSELQSLMRISYAVFCLKKQKHKKKLK